MVMNVLSLFNGMSTGHTALDNVGIKVGKYYSSEIKPAAIKLTQHHYPDTIQLGDVNKWKEWDIDWKSIDMVLSGSPCQDLSAAGKRIGLYGTRSSLFFVFVDILNYIKELNPNVLFLQENVGSAPKKDVGIMSRALGVYPVRINSSLVTAQLRDRYYWSNIRTAPDGMFGDIVTDIPEPKDKKIILKDILTEGNVDRDKHTCLMEGYIKKNIFDTDQESWEKYIKNRPTGMVTLIKSIENKTQKEIIPKIVNVRKYDVDIPKLQKVLSKRNITIKEIANKLSCKKTLVEHWFRKDSSFSIPLPEYWEELKTLLEIDTDEFDKSIITFEEKESNYEQTNRVYGISGKSPCITKTNPNIRLNDGLKVRLVNKIEMCRLQGFPDDWCDILSYRDAGSLLGDGWTLPIIEHIFGYINEK